MSLKHRFGKSLVFVALLMLASRSFYSGALAKEIEATSEWQLIGENDTLPAGLHIKMDLSTGEKWAKLQEDEGKDRISTASTSSTSLTMVPKTDTDTDSSPNNNDEGDQEPDYDFEMMHRTLLQLPPEEHQRMGGFPQVPEGRSIASLPEYERELVEGRLRQIWEQRQAELMSIEQEQVADLPEILKQRIASIKAYLQDPVGHFESTQQLDKPEKQPENTETLDDDDDDDENEPQLHSIVDVLEDLEYLLTDLDMTRDFYTLGGWPLLASLVSDQVHMDEQKSCVANDNDNNDDNDNDTEQRRRQVFVQRVKSNAAWALGTAVKNTGEFAPWAVEGLVVGDANATTALDLVHNALESSWVATTSTSMTLSSQRNLQQKLVYALGSFLRGNWPALVHFGAAGPAALRAGLEQFSVCPSALSHCRKMTRRLLSLTSDVVQSVAHEWDAWHSDNDPEAAGMVQALHLVRDWWATEDWCKPLELALEQDPDVSHTLVHGLSAFDATCEWSPATFARLKALQTEWQQDASGNAEELQALASILLVKKES